MQKWGRSSQETTVQPWGRVLVPQGMYIYNNILLSFAGSKVPTQMKDWMMMLTFQTSINYSLLTLSAFESILCCIMLYSSPLLNMLKASPVLLFAETLLQERSLVFSLLAASNKSFLLIFGLVLSIGWRPAERWSGPSFWITASFTMGPSFVRPWLPSTRCQ